MIHRRLWLRLGPALVAALASCMAAAQTPPTQPAPDPAAVPRFEKLDSMEARVQGCVTCHGQQGQGTRNDYFPRIAGKPAAYLHNQLRAFRDGTRRYPAMNYLVAYLTDDYLREMAEYFAALKPASEAPPTPKVAPAVLEQGRLLATQGDPARQIPACVACHGAQLTGMLPGLPGLAGLRPNYIAAQLTRWRTGDRRAAAPDCMQRIASRLSDPDITALSAWLGAQRLAADASPEPRNTQRMPMACGSQG